MSKLSLLLPQQSLNKDLKSINKEILVIKTNECLFDFSRAVCPGPSVSIIENSVDLFQYPVKVGLNV